MKNKIIKYLPLVLLVTLFSACDNTDENTGDSSLDVNLQTVTIDYPYSAVTSVIESDKKYPFTISIPQAVEWDVVLKIAIKSGTATNGEDYSVPEFINIPAGSTSGSASIDIYEDDEIEDTESFTLVIGDQIINSNGQQMEVSFNIINLTSGDISLDLSWAMSEKTTDSSGDEIDPTDFADLILRVSTTPDNSGDIAEQDGSGFETLVLPADTPDGTYYVSASFSSANEVIVRDLDLTLELNQTGTINDESYSFSEALNSGFSCSIVYYIMGELTKSGENYTFTEVGEAGTSIITDELLAGFIGTAAVVQDDWADYDAGDPVEIEEGSSPTEIWIRNYDNGAIANPDTAYLIVTIDPLTGDVTLVSNEDYEYGCDKGLVTGSGSVNACAGSIDVVLEFDLGGCGTYPDERFVLQL